MAITCVEANSGGSTNNGGNVTITFGANIAENDVVIVMGGHGATETTLTGPTGYTEVATHTGAAPVFGVWYKVMGATPDSSVTGNGGGNIADGVAYCAIVLRGVDTTNVLDVAATTAGPTTSTNPDPPSITPTTAGAWIVVAAGSNVADVALDEPTGYVNLVQQDGNDTVDLTAMGATKFWVSGAEDPGAFNNVLSGDWYAVTMAIRPAAATTSFRGSLLRGNTG